MAISGVTHCLQTSNVHVRELVGYLQRYWLLSFRLRPHLSPEHSRRRFSTAHPLASLSLRTHPFTSPLIHKISHFSRHLSASIFAASSQLFPTGGHFRIPSTMHGSPAHTHYALRASSIPCGPFPYFYSLISSPRGGVSGPVQFYFWITLRLMRTISRRWSL